MVKVKKVHEHHPATAVLGACLDTKGDSAFIACLDGSVQRFHWEEKKSQTLTHHESYASGVRLATKSNQLVSAGYDGVLRWVDMESSETTRTVQAHDFWSWNMDVSSDERWVASATGQYLAGGYKYEPAEEVEPSVKVFDLQTGEMKWAFEHTPSVQAVAISPDNNLVAAGNLMGQVRLWSLADGKLLQEWQTKDFTSWGIIKSHCYIGGIHAIRFSADSKEVYVAGMGPMRDPMAGNGRQRWQRFSCETGERLGQSNDKECGEGLIETLAFHPSGECFVMAGRLRGGQWNTAIFATDSGKRLHHLNSSFRVTEAVFSSDGKHLMLAGAVRQAKQTPKDPKPFGRLQYYEFSLD